VLQRNNPCSSLLFRWQLRYRKGWRRYEYSVNNYTL